MSTTHPDTPKKSFTKTEAVMSLFVLAILIGVGYQMLHQVPKTPTPTAVEQKPKHSDIDVYIDAQAIIKKTLKSPSTAKFPSSSEAKITHGEGEVFNVESYVDSQNGFGAMIRSDWSVMFEYVGDQVDTYAIKVDGETIYRKPGI